MQSRHIDFATWLTFAFGTVGYVAMSSSRQQLEWLRTACGSILVIMKIRIARSDGGCGSYVQGNARRASMLIRRLDPKVMYSGSVLIIGELNPFTVINTGEICWIEVETRLETLKLPIPNIDRVRRLTDRGEYEALLARQWPRWQKNPKGKAGDMLEALIEISFRGGSLLYLHVTGRVANISLVDAIFGAPAITGSFESDGTVYINPKAIVRARIYHSISEVTYPTGIWVATADDV